MNKLKVLIGFFFVGAVQAGNIDLSLAIDLQLPEEVDYLQEADFSMTVTNHGPDLAGGNSTNEFPISLTSFSFYIPDQLPFFAIIKDTSIEQNCFNITALGRHYQEAYH